MRSGGTLLEAACTVVTVGQAGLVVLVGSNVTPAFGSFSAVCDAEARLKPASRPSNSLEEGHRCGQTVRSLLRFLIGF